VKYCVSGSLPELPLFCSTDCTMMADGFHMPSMIEGLVSFGQYWS
jgi:hypothetical protein